MTKKWEDYAFHKLQGNGFQALGSTDIATAEVVLELI